MRISNQWDNSDMKWLEMRWKKVLCKVHTIRGSGHIRPPPPSASTHHRTACAWRQWSPLQTRQHQPNTLQTVYQPTEAFVFIFSYLFLHIFQIYTCQGNLHSPQKSINCLSCGMQLPLKVPHLWTMANQFILPPQNLHVFSSDFTDTFLSPHCNWPNDANLLNCRMQLKCGFYAYYSFTSITYMRKPE